MKQNNKKSAWSELGKNTSLQMQEHPKHEIRREELVKAARNIIVTRGYAATTLREIAKEAGCAIGTLNYYVSSREEMLLMIADYASEQARKRGKLIEKEHQGLEALRQTVRFVLPIDQTRDFRWKFWFNAWEELSKSEAGRKWLENHHTESLANYRRLIRTAQKRGEISKSVNATLAAGSLVAFIDGIAVQVFIARQNLSSKQQIAYIENWINGILTPLS